MSQAPGRAGHISGGRYPYQTEVLEPSDNQSALGHLRAVTASSVLIFNKYFLCFFWIEKQPIRE